MCNLAGKSWADYFRLKESETFLNELSQNMGIPMFKLIESRRGKNGGTYVHELVAYNLAQWCSPKIAVFVAKLLQAIRNGEIVLLRNNLHWKGQRFEAKDSNKLLNQALNEVLGADVERYHFSNEARMIFKIVTNQFPKDYRETHRVKEARDALSPIQLLWIDRLQRISCTLIYLENEYQSRKQKLSEYYNINKHRFCLEDTTNNLPMFNK
jgi:hypothetical protein